MTQQATAEPSKPRAQRESVTLRYEKCRECGLDWNVSKQAPIPKSGYLCPKCWGRYRNR